MGHLHQGEQVSTLRRVVQTALVMALAGIITVLIACSSPGEPEPTATESGRALLRGSVSIGPLCPVEPCTSTINPYEGLELVVRAEPDRVARRIALEDDGSFEGVVSPGRYSVNIEPCEFLGCDFELPIDIELKSGDQKVLDINIDTGIR